MADPIQDKFLDSRDLFALRYSDGLAFLEVEEYEDVVYESFSELGQVMPMSGLSGGYQRLEDSSGDDILYVPSQDDNTIVHVGIGVSPAVMELYASYPEGSRSGKSVPNSSTQPTPGSDFGQIDGTDSPYRGPTDIAEFIIPPKQRLSFNFYNPDTDVYVPQLRLVLRKYRVEALDPTNGTDKNAVNRILSPGSPAPIKTVGNFTSKPSFNLSKEWGVEAREKDSARKVVSGNRGGR